MDATRTMSPVARAPRLNAPEPDSIADSWTVSRMMAEVGRRARAAARRLALSTEAEKSAALRAMAERIRARSPDILAANAGDVADARANGQTPAFIDRLSLDDKRLDAVADAVAGIADL